LYGNSTILNEELKKKTFKLLSSNKLKKMVNQISATILFLMIIISCKSQQIVKIKKEDNRLLFFQIGEKNDTIIKNKTDLFFIKLPDSLKNMIKINVENGKFFKSNGENIYKLTYIKNMKYSHTIKDTVLESLLEGVSQNSTKISVTFKNVKTSQSILNNNFFLK